MVFIADNKVQRQRPVAEKSTRIPLEENEHTTIGQREIFNRPSRRPLTTQQAIPTTLQDETETHDFFLDTKLTSRMRNSSPTSVITTSLLTPTVDSGKTIYFTNYPHSILCAYNHNFHFIYKMYSLQITFHLY